MATLAGIAQLVEHNLAKVRVGGSSLLSRSKKNDVITSFFFVFIRKMFKRKMLLIRIHQLYEVFLYLLYNSIIIEKVLLLTSF